MSTPLFSSSGDQRSLLSSSQLTSIVTAVKILAPAETVHILPDGDLQVKKSKSFSNFEYCPLNRVNYREKDAKIQCVCLITSKPEVVPDKGTRAICFTVADKSGQVSPALCPFVSFEDAKNR